MAKSFFPIACSIGHEDHGGKGIYYNEEGISDERWQVTMIFCAIVQGKISVGQQPNIELSVDEAILAVKEINKKTQ